MFSKMLKSNPYSKLKKEPLVASPLTEARRELLEKSRNLLGYAPMDEYPICCEVQEKLNELGYDFLTTETVLRYQMDRSGAYGKDRPIDLQTINVYWPMVSIEKYSDPIPEFALSKAVELKEAFPSARFYVQILKADPFLAMLYKDKRFYVEVWEEPGFEGRQVAPDKKKSSSVW